MLLLCLDSLTCPGTRARSKVRKGGSTGTKGNTRANKRTRTKALIPPSFVTAPALQTVHALGHGLATTLALAQRDQRDYENHDGGGDRQGDSCDQNDWNDGEMITADMKTSSAILPISIPDVHDASVSSWAQSNRTAPVTSPTQISQSNLTASVTYLSQNNVMEMIDTYARAAVQLANQTWKQRQTHNTMSYNTQKKKKHDFDSTSAAGHQSRKTRKITRKQSELDNVLYDVNDEVVHEWISFLRRI